jgi:hypothetical protein
MSSGSVDGLRIADDSLTADGKTWSTVGAFLSAFHIHGIESRDQDKAQRVFVVVRWSFSYHIVTREVSACAS